MIHLKTSCFRVYTEFLIAYRSSLGGGTRGILPNENLSALNSAMIFASISLDGSTLDKGFKLLSDGKADLEG